MLSFDSLHDEFTKAILVEGMQKICVAIKLRLEVKKLKYHVLGLSGNDYLLRSSCEIE